MVYTTNTLLFLLLALTVAAETFAQTGKPQPNPQEQRISFATRDDTLLGALVRLTSSNSLPLGLILGLPGSRALCEEAKDQRFEGANIEQILTDLIDSSKYKWSFGQGVIHVFRINIPKHVSYILNHKFLRFSPFQATMQGIGVILAGDAHMDLYPGEGVAGSIPSSPDAMEIAPFTAENVSYEKIMDSVVSKGGKGVWFMYPDTSEYLGKQRDEVKIQIRSYVYDRWALNMATSCGPAAP